MNYLKTITCKNCKTIISSPMSGYSVQCRCGAYTHVYIDTNTPQGALRVYSAVESTVKRQYHNNGKLASEFHFRDDKRHGGCRVWDDNGKLYFDGYFRDNILIEIPEGVLPVEP